jgi:hypothetical protein
MRGCLTTIPARSSSVADGLPPRLDYMALDPRLGALKRHQEKSCSLFLTEYSA